MHAFLKHARWLSLLLLAGLTAIFIAQNAAVVELRFLFLTVEARRAYIVGVSVFLGALVGWLFGATRK